MSVLSDELALPAYSVAEGGRYGRYLLTTLALIIRVNLLLPLTTILHKAWLMARQLYLVD